MYSIRKHLRVGCATCSGLFIGRLSALTLHLAAIEAHERILAASGCESTAKPLSKDEARRIAAKWRSCRPSCTTSIGNVGKLERLVNRLASSYPPSAAKAPDRYSSPLSPRFGATVGRLAGRSESICHFKYATAE
jgi:hypothetical protein